VQQVRRTFFAFLKPYLSTVVTENCIRDTKGWNEGDIVFGKYFDVEKFDASFEGQ